MLGALTTAACAATPSVPPSPTPGTATPVGLTCADDHAFDAGLLEQPGRAETEPDPAAAALRAYLLSPEGGAQPPDGQGLPRSGWVRVAQTGDRVQFVAPKADGAGWAVVGFLGREGAWALDLAGECLPEVALPAGISRAEWRLDPAFPVPHASDRRIHVLINERACASGQAPEGRVEPPVVMPSEGAMIVSVRVRERPGVQDCQGNPDFAMTVDLPEPLGQRLCSTGASIRRAT